MRTAHDGMKIRESEFNALVEDLEKAMKRIDLPIAAQNDLIAKLAPMRKSDHPALISSSS